MPDQYVLSALQRLELAKRHRRHLFAEVDLVSSHTPWTRIPRRIDWRDVGDGSVFNNLPEDSTTKPALWSDSAPYARRTARSIQYTMGTLVSFVRHYADPNLVLIVLGDHQPSTVVTGRPRATTCRSRLLPTTRRCWTGSPGGAGTTACGPSRKRRSGR